MLIVVLQEAWPMQAHSHCCQVIRCCMPMSREPLSSQSCQITQTSCQCPGLLHHLLTPTPLCRWVRLLLDPQCSSSWVQWVLHPLDSIFACKVSVRSMTSFHLLHWTQGASLLGQEWMNVQICHTNTIGGKMHTRLNNGAIIVSGSRCCNVLENLAQTPAGECCRDIQTGVCHIRITCYQ